MRRNRIIAAFSGLLLVGGGCLILGIFWEGSYLPNKPCRPVVYPEGQTTTEQLSYDINDSIEAVLEFYDQRLNVQPFPGDTGQWRREELSTSKYLYSCYGVDINLLTTETGCIYVNPGGAGTHIETQLLKSEGGSIPCPR